MANLNQVQGESFSPERWVHQRFIFLPRTIDTLFSVRREEMHCMDSGFEDHAFEMSGGSETTSACGDTYFCALLGS